MYPAYMEESIRKLEATMERRLKETFPRIAEEEKKAGVRTLRNDLFLDNK